MKTVWNFIIVILFTIVFVSVIAGLCFLLYTFGLAISGVVGIGALVFLAVAIPFLLIRKMIRKITNKNKTQIVG